MAYKYKQIYIVLRCTFISQYDAYLGKGALKLSFFASDAEKPVFSRQIPRKFVWHECCIAAFQVKFR